MKKKLVYIHGLGGGKNGRVPKLIKKAFGNNVDVFAPEIPISPKEAYQFVNDYINKENPDLVIGSSLGAFYTLLLPSNYLKVVINPAMHPSKDIKDGIGLGTYPYRHKRDNKEQTYTVDKKFINALSGLYRRYLSKEENKDNVYGIFGKRDCLFSHINDFMKRYGRKHITILKNEFHHISDESVNNYVIPLIDKLINKEAN